MIALAHFRGEVLESGDASEPNEESIGGDEDINPFRAEKNGAAHSSFRAELTQFGLERCQFA